MGDKVSIEPTYIDVLTRLRNMVDSDTIPEVDKADIFFHLSCLETLLLWRCAPLEGLERITEIKKGDTVVLSGDSSELGLDDYNVRVSTTALVLETPKDTDRDVLVNIMEIDGDAYVTAYVRKDKIRRKV